MFASKHFDGVKLIVVNKHTIQVKHPWLKSLKKYEAPYGA